MGLKQSCPECPDPVVTQCPPPVVCNTSSSSSSSPFTFNTSPATSPGTSPATSPGTSLSRSPTTSPGTSTSSCPAGTKVSKQTTKSAINTLSCYGSNGNIIGSPIINSPPISNICTADTTTRISYNNILTHINTGYYQCNQDATTLLDTNPCPSGYTSAITPTLNLDGSITYTCTGNGPFTCPLNVTPITTTLNTGVTAKVCNILPTSQFTNVNGFKSKRERNVESFSQNTNDKCKVRY
jgi:hypothetical protein